MPASRCRHSVRELDVFVTGQLPAGTPLRLAPLPAQLGVSIIPVRGAFRLLQMERLVVSKPRRGAVAAPLLIDDIEEAHAVRVALEGLAARHLAERLTPADTSDLEDAVARMARAKDANAFSAFHNFDRGLHMRPYAASGRDRLVLTICELVNRS